MFQSRSFVNILLLFYLKFDCRSMKNEFFSFLKKYKIYIGILLFFLTWMLFFDEYNLVRVNKDRDKLEELNEEKEYLKSKIDEDKEKLQKLQSDKTELERYAREEYLMKKKDEDIFLIIEE